MDENGLMVAQRDSHPGLGNFPTSQWQPGDRFVDTIRLHTTETMYAPGEANLSIGLYAPDAYRLGITAADGTGLGDVLTLGTIELQPAVGEAPNPLNQNFNNELKLVGYEYNGRTFHPGDVLAVTLYWQAFSPLATDFEVKVGLCDDPCEPWMSPRITTTPLLPPSTPTWTPGQIISQTVPIALGEELAPGTYLIHVALIDPMTKEPQNVLAEDGHILDNRLLLSRVRVDP
jgi:hypothetical protein